jgi:L-fuconolactonase
MRIDSHQHFWIYEPVKDGWIPDHMASIRRDFLPEEVLASMVRNNISDCVLVQADQSERETYFLLELAERYDFIKGVVGWVDLRSGNIAGRLKHFSQYTHLKGFRHIVQAEKQVDFLLDPDFIRGISFLDRYGFTYDILIYPRHLPYALELVKKFPSQRFVIDHLAKPLIRDGETAAWERGLRPFAACANVFCKMAGLVTEADQEHWRMEDLGRYIEIVFDIFGPDRVMFGSDWPVCLPAASYDQVCAIVEYHTSFLSLADKDKLWGLNCSRFYNL